MKFKIILSAIIIAIVAGAVVYTQSMSSDPLTIISTIEPLLGSDMTPTMDYHDDLGIDGIQSLGYKIEQSGKYHLYYGNIDITLKPEDFKNVDIIHALDRIGITVYVNKESGEYTFKYLGEDVEKLSGSY